MNEYILQVLKDIMAIDSPSGYTKEVIQYCQNLAHELGYQTQRTKKGNLEILVKGQDDYTIGFCAHVDTLGLMVRSIKSDGTLAFTNVGGPIIPTLDGEYCKVYTRNNKVYTGTILSNSPAAHVFSDSKDAPRNCDTMCIRLDEVVKTIRQSKDKQDAKLNLETKYGFSSKQSEAIVTLQLYRLTNTDIVALENEKTQLEAFIVSLNEILDSDAVLRKVIIKELKEVKKQYPSPRLTEIKNEIQDITINEEAMILPEDIYVSVTRDGYIKRISQRSYKASGQTVFGKKEEDQLIDLHFANTLDKLLVFTDKGNYLYIPLHKLEEFKWKELGKHISYLIKVSPEEKIIGSILVKDFDLPLYVVFASKFGQMKRVQLKDFDVSRYTRSMKCMNLKEGDTLIQVGLSDGHQGIVMTSQAGYAVLISEEEISVIGIKAGGMKGMNLKNDELVSMNIFNPSKSDSYVLISDQPGIKRLRISDIPACHRATKGNLVFKSPKSNIINTLQTYVIDLNEVLEIYTKDHIEAITVKDYSYGQLNSKPSVITSLKDQTILSVYDQRTLSTDMYNDIVQNDENTHVFDVPKDPELFDTDVLEKNVQQDVTQVKNHHKKHEEKEFEPISFDDLFNDDF